MGEDDRAHPIPTAHTLFSGETPCAARDSFAHPRGNLRFSGIADERADFGCFVRRISEPQFRHMGQEAFRPLLMNAALHENPLYGDADLPGVGERPDRTAGGCVGLIGIAVNDHGRVAAEFEDHALTVGQRLQVPSYLVGAGEGEHGKARVGGEHRADDMGISRREYRERFARPAGSGNHFGQQQCGERCLLRWFQDDRAPRCESRRNLVGDEVQRKVEGRDRRDRAGGEPLGKSDSPSRRRVQIEREDIPSGPPRLFGSKREDEQRSIDLEARIAEGLPRFIDDTARELFPPRRDSVVDCPQDVVTFGSRKCAGMGERARRRRYGTFGVHDRSHRRLPDDTPVPRAVNRSRFAVVLPLSGNVLAVRFDPFTHAYYFIAWSDTAGETKRSRDTF